jgi:hypothetical protein
MGMHAHRVRGCISADHPGLPAERFNAMEINSEEGAKPIVTLAFRLSPAEMDELKSS